MKLFILILSSFFIISSPVLAKSKKANTEQFSCAERKYCKEMSSCAEAKYHLNECGEGRLDRDGDGVPCENVCRR
ncbi:excalibur calcium-binding domain-containing protein [Haemophilus sp. HMSC068C11]|jgi:prophage muMc02, nuclease, putative|uniref:excalibur calcium-binding domain-containing protein n=1 Tax=Haemophilus sp. HMSC068C11 TaxID=1739522 RepID=UPI0008A424B8|nr:excalibur calcium-binding domain-containing protein [Haemophilus sp. HMSC068C11]MBS6188186.1 excalibur calcium-binding domain-containing protein [Haemophilus parainfluenzae]MBS7127678.1 excalibur calcium-binding domain-containing protein [Haemophilus parainfluenzae]MDU4896980.1 excalibur calcium-binding domain-containing protein [Haemophilus parainfluenzae]MDU5649248.1 excalibur calcium-binding domain-containing protein [Haemophilus parainfluenzae]MDU6707033.1 excalibur calcium-binding doma